MSKISSKLEEIFKMVERLNIYRVEEKEGEREFKIGELIFIEEKLNDKFKLIIEDSKNMFKKIVIYNGSEFNEMLTFKQTSLVEEYLVELVKYLEKRIDKHRQRQKT